MGRILGLSKFTDPRTHSATPGGEGQEPREARVTLTEFPPGEERSAWGTGMSPVQWGQPSVWTDVVSLLCPANPAHAGQT